MDRCDEGVVKLVGLQLEGLKWVGDVRFALHKVMSLKLLSIVSICGCIRGVQRARRPPTW